MAQRYKLRKTLKVSGKCKRLVQHVLPHMARLQRMTNMLAKTAPVRLERRIEECGRTIRAESAIGYAANDGINEAQRGRYPAERSVRSQKIDGCICPVLRASGGRQGIHRLMVPCDCFNISRSV